MANTLFVTATEQNSGKTMVSLGLMRSLSGLVSKVGFFKPVWRLDDARTYARDAALIERIYHVDALSDEEPIGMGEVRDALSTGEEEKLIGRISDRYERIAQDKDVVLVEGTDLSQVISAAGSRSVFDFNAGIAKRLSAHILLIVDGGAEKSVEDIMTHTTMSRDLFTEQGCHFLGAIINKVDREKLDDVDTYVRRTLRKQGVDVFGVVPYNPLLPKPRLAEIAEKLEARVLYGQEHLSNVALHTIVAAMSVRNMLNYIEEGTLIITPGDRDDVLLAVAATSISQAYPGIAGLVLTGGLHPHANIKRLIDKVPGVRIPILLVDDDTHTISSKLDDMAVTIRAEDSRKIELACELIQDNVDEKRIYTSMQLTRTKQAAPREFLDRVVAEARTLRKHIVFPEGNEERTLRAAARIVERGIADVTLLGDTERIPIHAAEIGVDVSRARIIEPAATDLEAYAQTYFELRKHKGVTLEQARDQVQDPVCYGTMMVALEEADGLVSGAIHSTAHTIRPALQIIRTKEGTSVASSVFFMCLEDRVVLYGDCAIVTDPTAEQLADIALTSAETALAFGIEPYVAMLSYSTGESGMGASVQKVREATALARAKNPDLPLEGPIQFDAAYDEEVAKIKFPKSKVAGKASVYIFPDLNAGNIAYKAVQRSSGALAIGPVLQGLNRPVNDLSRGCSVEDIIYVTAMTAIQAKG
ncbi:MAG: phosphate acetyltransferase [Candidatus Latescibacteria bacterium]|nr:phosphate acetyltransferase [Candidatus Latescibacterota bacterium]